MTTPGSKSGGPTWDGGGQYWSEPFIVTTWDNDEQCQDCGADARWQIEVIGWDSSSAAPEAHPTEYTCSQHLAALMNRWA